MAKDLMEGRRKHKKENRAEMRGCGSDQAFMA
jgi:hypothetical protein